MKTNIFIILWFIFLISWVTLLVHSTSLNDSFWVNKSFADIYFYNSQNWHNYNWNIITSPVYPLETIYTKAKTTLLSNPPATPVTVTVNNITIHSH